MIWFNAETNVHVVEVDFGNMKGCKFYVTKFIRYLNSLLPTYSIKRLRRGDLLPFYNFKLGMLNPFYWCPRWISFIQKEDKEFELYEYEIVDEYNVKSRICELNKILIFRDNQFMVLKPEDILLSDKKVVIFADNKMLKLGKKSSPPFVRKSFNYFRSVVDTHIMKDKEKQIVAKILYNKRILLNNNEESDEMRLVDRYKYRIAKCGQKKDTEKDVYLLDIKSINKVPKRKRYVKATFDSDQLFFYNESVYPRTFHSLLAANKDQFPDYYYENFDVKTNMPVARRKGKWARVAKYNRKTKYLKDRYYQVPERFNKEKIRFEVSYGDEEGNIKKDNN